MRPIAAGAWSGARCFVVGGGPSLRKFDWRRLKGERVIAVNRAIEAVPWAEILYTMDARFLAWFRRQVHSFRGRLVLMDGGPDPAPDRLVPPGAIRLRCAGERVLTDRLEDGLGSGANSGFGAMNLALILGADPIYLLGFDLGTRSGRQEWWHDGYPVNDGSRYDQFRGNFEWAARQIPEGRVLNASLVSMIRGFPVVATWPPHRKVCRSEPVFVAYFTSSYYRRQAERLQASCARLGLDLVLERVEDRGSWVANCGAKAAFIRSMLERHPKRNVVYLDADAEVVGSPDLFWAIDGDVAAHRRGGHELLSGTIWFRNCPATRTLVDRWIALGEEYPEAWDQGTLAQALQELEDRVRFVELPASYTMIFDSMRAEQPDVEPVILHHQASRLVKQLERQGKRP